MTQNWMIDVLRDIRSFATKNAMIGLAEHLDDAIVIASVELRQQAEDMQMMSGHECDPLGNSYRKAFDS